MRASNASLTRDARDFALEIGRLLSQQKPRLSLGQRLPTARVPNSESLRLLLARVNGPDGEPNANGASHDPARASSCFSRSLIDRVDPRMCSGIDGFEVVRAKPEAVDVRFEYEVAPAPVVCHLVTLA